MAKVVQTCSIWTTISESTLHNPILEAVYTVGNTLQITENSDIRRNGCA